MAREEAKLQGDKLWKFFRELTDEEYNRGMVGGAGDVEVQRLKDSLLATAHDAGVITAQTIKDAAAECRNRRGENFETDRAEERLLAKFADHVRAKGVAVSPRGGAEGQAR